MREEINFARFPRKIKRVYRYAMSAYSRAGIKGHKSVWFCFSRFNHLPEINAHFIREHFKFVYERDVYQTENVFINFAHFRGARRGDRMDFIQKQSEKFRRPFC